MRRDTSITAADVREPPVGKPRELAPFFSVEARCPNDGIIEAVRYDHARGPVQSYVAAVQWHPEFHDWNNPSLLSGDPLLNDFLDATRAARRANAAAC